MKYKEVEIDKITPPETAIREMADEDKFRELVGSIETRGLIQPIVLREEGDLYEIVAGHRRYLACKALEMKNIPAVITPKAGIEAEIMKLHENTVREDISAIDEGVYYLSLREKYNMTNDEIAKAIGKSDTLVSRKIGLTTLPDNLAEAVRDGRLHWTAAAELNRLGDESVRDYYAEIAMSNGATHPVIRGWVNTYLEDQKKPERSGDSPEAPPAPDEIKSRVIARKYRCAFCGVTPDQQPLDSMVICYGCRDRLELELRQPS